MRSRNFVIALLVIAAGFAGQWRLESAVAHAAARSASTRRAFGEFPSYVGAWRVEQIGLNPRQMELLRPDDSLYANFSEPGAASNLSVYVGFYGNPDTATQHPPDVCYPGGGWTKTHKAPLELSVAGINEKMSVDETVFERAGERQLVVYWYVSSGYKGANAGRQKVARLKRLLSGEAVVGAAKIQIAVPVQTDRAGAEARLAAFLADFLPVLEEFLPKEGNEGK